MQTTPSSIERPRLFSRQGRRLAVVALVAVIGTLVGFLLFNGSGSNSATVIPGGEPTGSNWFLSRGELLPLGPGDFDITKLDPGGGGGMSAGPTYHSIMGRGFDSEGTEVLVSGVWSRATEGDEWVSNGVLTEPIHATGLTSILRDSPAAGNRPATMDLVWRNESFRTACYIVEYDAADGTRKNAELCAHIGGTALPEAADDPNVSIRPVPRRAWQPLS